MPWTKLGIKKFFVTGALLSWTLLNVHAGSSPPLYKPLQIESGTNLEKFGASVCQGGDFDQDGFQDILAGVMAQGGGAGRIEIRSGKTGTILQQILGPLSAEKFGTAVENLQDINGDGFDDFAVGAPASAGKPGQCLVYCGKSGTLLFHLSNNIPSDAFGTKVKRLGDINQDGSPDFAVSAPFWPSPFLEQKGYVQVRSGKTGIPLQIFFGPLGGGVAPGADSYGFDLAAFPDVDGDQIDELAVGAPNLSTSSPDLQFNGMVEIRSGSTGVLLFRHFGDHAFDFLGSSVGGGNHLVLAGAPNGLTFSQTRAGYVKGLDIWTGNLAFYAEGAEDGHAFGAKVLYIPQFDLPTNPGNEDVVLIQASSPLASQGFFGSQFYLYSPVGELREFFTYPSVVESDVNLGGDVDGNELTQEFLLGSRAPFQGGGQICVFGNTRASFVSFGASCGNSLTDINPAQYPNSAPPHLSVDGHPLEGGSLTVRLDDAFGLGSVGVLLMSFQSAQNPITIFGSCSLLLDPSTLLPVSFPFPLNQETSSTIVFSVPPGIPLDARVNLQAFHWISFPFARAATNGIAIRFLEGSIVSTF